MKRMAKGEVVLNLGQNIYFGPKTFQIIKSQFLEIYAIQF